MKKNLKTFYLYRFLIQWRRLLRQNGFFLRALLCLGIACIILKNDELSSYDTRLQIRGQRPLSDQIAMINLNPADFNGEAFKSHPKNFDNLKALEDISDSFYWDKKTWLTMLSHLLAAKPKAIIVNLYFSKSLKLEPLTDLEKSIFYDSRIFWISGSTPIEKTSLPLFANETNSNVGSATLIKDEDGIIRKFSSEEFNYRNILELATNLTTKYPNQIINFKTINKYYNKYTLQDVLNPQASLKPLKDKYIIINSVSPHNDDYLTPLGPASKGEVLMNILDNFLQDSFISRSNFGFYILGLFALMILCVLIVTQYPHTVAFFFLLWIATLTGALSAWVFDSYSFWVPIVSPMVEIAAIWIVFIGYQASKIERKHRELQQEQVYLQELEQLKNNFVSLISHDLKTPIAKIQGIVDRILTYSLSPEIESELRTLRIYNEELNKYIQSIIRLLRVESRDFKIHKEVCDINQLIEEAFAALRPLAREKQILMSHELEPMFSVELDMTLIREVMINLIENAIKYTPEGGVIEVSSYESQENLYVEVKDSGPGIPDAELEQIWGKFVRGKDQNHKTKGTGLGLYLVKYFIELHHGRVGIESKLGEGTKVFFTLPIESDN